MKLLCQRGTWQFSLRLNFFVLTFSSERIILSLYFSLTICYCLVIGIFDIYFVNAAYQLQLRFL